MTQLQRLLQSVIDTRGRRGRDQLCAVVKAEASSGSGDSRSDARRPRMRDHDRRDNIMPVGRGLFAVPNPRPGRTDSP